MLWYFVMTLLEDEETQKRGVIFVTYVLDGDVVLEIPKDAREIIWRGTQIFPCLPIRIIAIHGCLSDNRFTRGLLALALLGFPPDLRRRIKPHFGMSYLVFVYLLQFTHRYSTHYFFYRYDFPFSFCSYYRY